MLPNVVWVSVFFFRWLVLVRFTFSTVANVSIFGSWATSPQNRIYIFPKLLQNDFFTKKTLLFGAIFATNKSDWSRPLDRFTSSAVDSHRRMQLQFACRKVFCFLKILFPFFPLYSFIIYIYIFFYLKRADKSFWIDFSFPFSYIFFLFHFFFVCF